MTEPQHTVDPRRWQALALVCVAFFMTILDVSIVNVALPSIKTSLNVSRFEPAMGDHRVRDHLRRVPAARRAARRPPRTAADLHGRRRAVLRRIARVRTRRLDRDARSRRARYRASAPRSSRRRRSRSSRRRSTRAPSGTRRSGSGARWAAAAPRPACSSAESSRTTSAGSGSSSSTFRSASSCCCSRAASCARAASKGCSDSTSAARSPRPRASRC